jgi:hypothetical protein
LAAYSTMPRLTTIRPFGPAPAFIDRLDETRNCQMQTPTRISWQIWVAAGRMRRNAAFKVSSTSWSDGTGAATDRAGSRQNQK